MNNQGTTYWKLHHERFTCSCSTCNDERRTTVDTWKMYFLNFFLLQLIVASHADSSSLIRDYFVFKNVNRVAGFSCGELSKDREVVKVLNEIGIAVSIKPLRSVTDVASFLRTNYWNLGVLLDLHCPFVDEDVTELFSKTSTHFMFDHLHQWLVFGKNMSRTVELINDTEFSIVTDFAIVMPRNDDYVLYDVYNHCKHCGGLLNITELGTWTEGDGLNITLSLDKFSRRRNYHRMKVKVAGLVVARPKNQKLEQYLQEVNIIRVDNWAKFGYTIMVHVAELFNFTFEVIELNYWDKNDNNGPLMSGLHQGLYDMGYFPSILTNERLNLAAVILQVWPVRTCFMFLTVPSLKRDMNIIFKPFAKNVWHIVLLLISIIIFALWTILKVEKDAVDSDYGTPVLIIVAALCQQGFPFFSSQFASRIVFLQAMIFGLLVYNYYSAAIVSSRLNAPLDKMNDSLYSLMKSGMKLGAFKDIYFNILLHSSVEEIQYFKRHWEKIPEENRFYPLEKGIRKIMKPGFAFHTDPINAYPLIERIFDKQMICQLTEVHLLRPSSLGIWSTSHSQFQEITKIGLIKISTSGIQKREVLRWSHRKPFCDKDKYYVSSVTIQEMIPVILVLVSGFLLSLIICLAENVTFRGLRMRDKKRKPSNKRLNKYNPRRVITESNMLKNIKTIAVNKIL